METSRRNGNKRHSGVFDQPISSVPGLIRRTSKRASSNDRHGHVYTDEFTQGSIRAVTPDAPPERPSAFGSPGSGSDLGSPLARGLTSGQRQARDRAVRADLGSGQHQNSSASETKNRARTRTLDERTRDRSPQTASTKGRTRLGSMHALPATGISDSVETTSSIGFPSIVSSSGSQLQHRQRLVKSPPQPLSPTNDTSSANPSAIPSPSTSTDTSKILHLVKTTCGRMHGILYFRDTKTGPWSSGYLAINVASGSLIYQMKGKVDGAKALIEDLRGCTVRTQLDKESKSMFLEVSTTPSSCVHLRPHVPETFDSWLAALLCWQPLRPKEPQPKANAPQPSYTRIRRITGDRRRNSTINLTRDASIIKVGKMLYWDHEARVSTPSSTGRISTYKQQRSASGTPWMKISCTLQENGLLKIYREPETVLIHTIPMSSLHRYAIQRLHPTVLEDEFCLALFPQYRSNTSNALDLKWPIYFSLESRAQFEVWFVLLRAFTNPELYGPEQHAVRASVDLTIAEGQPRVANFEKMFRLERTVSLRIIEAKVFSSPAQSAELSKKPTKTRSSNVSEVTKGDYYAEVDIDGQIRGKTAVKADTGNPFWREDYEFSDLPPVLASASVAVRSRSLGQKDWTSFSDDQFDRNKGDVENLGLVGDVRVLPLDALIGIVSLHLDDIERGKDCEQWWDVINEKNQVAGEVLMKVRIDEAVVLVSKHYESLSRLLHTFSNGLTQQLAFAISGEGRKLHETLLNVFQSTGQASDWIMSLVEDEIDGIHKETPAPRYRYSRRIASNDSYDSGVEREMLLRDMGKNATQEANLLFRGNSILTKALDFHMRRLGKEYLEDTLGERIRDIDESDPDCEVDPNKIRKTEDLNRNWRNLIALTESVWLSIIAAPNRCPAELRIIFRHIRACAEDRYGDFLRTIQYSSVSGFLFLRFFCPAILNPKLFGLLKDHPRPRGLRTLTFIAKSLQCMANLSTFGSKEPWMEPMNAFINSHKDEFKSYLDQICSISPDQYVSRVPPASYTAPIQILSRLPDTSKEGFASLPYLIDRPRELAILMRTWTEATAEHRPTKQDGSDEIVAFDRLCYALRDRTHDTISGAMRAERPPSAIELNREDTIGKMGLPKRISTYVDYNMDSLRSAPSISPPSSSASAMTIPNPVSSLTRVARRFKMAQSSVEVTRNNSSVSLPSPRDTSTVPSPVTSQHDYVTVDTDRSPPFVPSPSGPGSTSASGVWDHSTDRDSGDNFPSHALAWDSSSGGHGIETDEAYSLAVDPELQSVHSPHTVASNATSARSIDVEDGSIRNEPGILKGTVTTTIVSGNSQRSPVSPREGRRLVDVWGFRKKDKDKERDRDRERERLGGSGPETRRYDAESARKSTLTKKDRERDKRDDKEKSKGKGKK